MCVCETEGQRTCNRLNYDDPEAEAGTLIDGLMGTVCNDKLCPEHLTFF